MEDRTFTIIDKDTGKEKVMKILFTYENSERHAQYVFLYSEDKPNEVVAYRYDDENNLFPLEDAEEYKEVEEVFNAYSDDPKINAHKE